LVPTHVHGALPVPSPTERAGDWFLQSGIQDANGGVARYYRSDLASNARVSTEITGYAVSALVCLYTRERRRDYLDAAVRAGEFLIWSAWDPKLEIFPFEHGDVPEHLSYFFDTGIIARGLIALWKASGRQEFLDGAVNAGESLARDFAASGGSFHPILRLPSKEPLPYEPQWSRSPGCYQLKSALAWQDLFVATGEERYSVWFERAVCAALRTHTSFLPAETPEKTMDRLHAYSYFLEASLALSGRPEVRTALAEGIDRVAKYLREIAPVFERSDVYAQLLRVRLLADDLGAVPLNPDAAEQEAGRIPEFQLTSSDVRIDGGFVFGCRGKQPLPYVNPVSTAFCLQALEMWRDYRAGVVLNRGPLI
jgi:hypothetical protein